MALGKDIYVLIMSIGGQPRYLFTNLFSRFLGTSGQNIDDLGKYSDAKDKLEFMERTLRWRHLAPTAPNTLGRSYMHGLFRLLLHIFFLLNVAIYV